jgi:3-dehydroquinate synthase II
MKKVILDATSGFDVKNTGGVSDVLVNKKEESIRGITQHELRDFFVLNIKDGHKMSDILGQLDMRLDNFLVKCEDWKIIPLENLIAYLSSKGKKVYFYVQEKKDLEYCFSILERGVDGIIVREEILPDALTALKRLERKNLELEEAEITRVEDAGDGDRVCVDTTSIFSLGEGLLVGSLSSFFFLVHSETIENNFVPTRQFRVNAGAVHSYVLTSHEKTSYLSELSAGSKVLAVCSDGKTRELTVGRVKIERRPLLIIHASTNNASGSIALQRAETVRLVSPDRLPLPVTSLKVGDRILVRTSEKKGRHVGLSYEEFMIER